MRAGDNLQQPDFIVINLQKAKLADNGDHFYARAIVLFLMYNKYWPVINSPAYNSVYCLLFFFRQTGRFMILTAGMQNRLF